MMRQLSIYDVARLAVAYWLRDDAITMVAIAGAESGYYEDRPSMSDVWGMPGDNESWRPYSCLGVYSWGLWQVFMPVHHYLLEEATGSPDPCFWMDYLCDGAHNAYIAYRIQHARQGFGDWSTYNDNSYLRFKFDATMAVDYVITPPKPAPPPPPPSVGPPPLTPVEPPLASVTPPASPITPPG